MRLSEPALTLARVAAIAASTSRIELAEAATGQRAVQLASAWQELQDAQVLRDEAFAHDLVADAVLRGVPPVVARRVHAQCADWLAAQGVEPARVAACTGCTAAIRPRRGRPSWRPAQRAGRPRACRSRPPCLPGRTGLRRAGLPTPLCRTVRTGLALVHADFGDQALAELQDLLTPPAATRSACAWAARWRPAERTR
jgi:hypothetical protein